MYGRFDRRSSASHLPRIVAREWQRRTISELPSPSAQVGRSEVAVQSPRRLKIEFEEDSATLCGIYTDRHGRHDRLSSEMGP